MKSEKDIAKFSYWKTVAQEREMQLSKERMQWDRVARSYIEDLRAANKLIVEQKDKIEKLEAELAAIRFVNKLPPVGGRTQEEMDADREAARKPGIKD